MASSSKQILTGDSSNKRTHQVAFPGRETASGSKGSVQQDPEDLLFWGPYLSERQWGTVREDYSQDGSCWDCLTYESATTHAYKWGEDGLLGVCDRFGLLCASLALWNEQDHILKERLFGLNGKQGNHGEDVKELYYYLHNTPNHSYMQALYKYPHKPYPYEALVDHGHSVMEPEYEILDTGIFDDNEYWDIKVEYAKPVTTANSLVCKYTVVNKSPKSAVLHIIPQFYFRNTWSANSSANEAKIAPSFQYIDSQSVDALYEAGIYHIDLFNSENVTFHELMFTNNDTVGKEEVSVPRDNHSRVNTMSVSTKSMQRMSSSLGMNYRKNAFHRYIIHGEKLAINRERTGTKVGAWMSCHLPAQGKGYVYWQIVPASKKGEGSASRLEQVVKTQRNRAEEFYLKVIPKGITADQLTICRQAVAGLLWSKQLYIYNLETKSTEVKELYGPEHFLSGVGKRSLSWIHLDCHHIILMPDKWEFPWFAAWDLAIHCVQFASIDLNFAKDQILLLLSDQFMHRNGQIPGCEFDLGDPNPPIVAWAVCKIHQQEQQNNIKFLKTCYPRLIINYQWWHKMDSKSTHLFGHGFLGMDNISVVDRSSLPHGINNIKQADATGWMGLFALNMLKITLDLCKYDNFCASDMAMRFLQDFLSIAKAINKSTDKGGLWCEKDRFYYDVAYLWNKTRVPIRLRSWSGIVPLLACARISLKDAPVVKSCLMRFDREYAPHVCKLGEDDFFLTLVPYVKLKSVLQRVFSDEEFLSPYGIRSLSKAHQENPCTFSVKDQHYTVSYQPGESESDMFGGNSNWRGPIWMCMNYLFVECMETYSELNKIFTHPLSMEYPTGRADGHRETFLHIAYDICQRVVSLYTPDEVGFRPANGKHNKYLEAEWKDLILFYEYFHADTGRGCGASHQTGWSALYVEFVRKLVTLKSSARENK